MELKLDKQLMVDSFFEDARLLGIVAGMNDYRFCSNANKILGFNFKNNIQLEIALKRKDRQYFFSIFEYSIPLQNSSHYVYNNQFDGDFLLQQFKNFNFLWLIKDEKITEAECEALAAIIQSIPGVQLVSRLHLPTIKQKENLIF